MPDSSQQIMLSCPSGHISAFVSKFTSGDREDIQQITCLTCQRKYRIATRWVDNVLVAFGPIVSQSQFVEQSEVDGPWYGDPPLVFVAIDPANAGGDSNA